jgi:hypothetical protein
MVISLLPLDVFREIMGILPYHFWQFTDPLAVDGSDECDVPWVHYRWLVRKGVGRFDMLSAIAKAEGMMAAKLGYWPFSKYNTEKVLLPRPRPFRAYKVPQATEFKWGHITSVGTQTWQSLSAGVALVYGATDEVTINLALATTVDVNEITVCYAGTHVPIRPIYCTLSGLNLTITIKKWLLGNPTKWTARVTDNTVMLNFNNVADRIATVDIYRVYVDSSAIHATFDTSLQCENEECTHTDEDICVSFTDERMPVIKWYPLNDSFYANTRAPESMTINYTHGLNHTNYGQYMMWAAAVSHFAVALLDDVGCDCKEADFAFRYWQEDMAHSDPGGSYALSSPRLGSPFGTKRGALEAWEFVVNQLGA